MLAFIVLLTININWREDLVLGRKTHSSISWLVDHSLFLFVVRAQRK